MIPSNKSRFRVDWLLSNLRWLLLISVAIVALIDDDLSAPRLLGLLLVGAAYNLVLLVLLNFDIFPKPLSYISLLVDSALAVALISLAGPENNSLLFFGLFPVITAALRFGWTINFITAGALTVAYALPSVLQQMEQSDKIKVAPLTIANAFLLFLAAIVTGVIGSRVVEMANRDQRLEEEVELQRLRAIRARANAVYEMASTLSATLNYQKVLEAMLDVSALGLTELESMAEEIVSMVLLFGENQLFVTASRGLTRVDRTRRLPGLEGVIAEALNTAEPCIIQEPGDDVELGQFSALQYLSSAVVVPLRAGFESYGVVVFASPLPDTFTSDRVELLVAVGNQAIIALQNAQLYQDLLAEKERIVEIEEDARKKLARDLHDGPTQSIAAIAMRLNYTNLLVDQDPTRAKAELAKIEDLARKTTKEIRHMLFTLRPIILETQGLTAALEQLLQKFQDTHNMIVELEVGEAVEEHLDLNAQGVIFYIIEEALSNARKHAEAEHHWVRLGKRRDSVYVQIEDDGVGFDVAGVQARYDERGSLGMINLHERTELVGGKIHIESAPGQGTRITLMVPLNEQVNE